MVIVGVIFLSSIKFDTPPVIAGILLDTLESVIKPLIHSDLLTDSAI